MPQLFQIIPLQNNIFYLMSMNTNIFGPKYTRRRTKRKSKEQKQSLFCLDQSQEANLAKSYLHSQTIWNQGIKPQELGTPGHKNNPQFSSTFDSWHGQRNISFKQINTLIIEKFVQPKPKLTERMSISSDINRRGTRSVDLRRSYKKIQNPVRKKSQVDNKTTVNLKNKLTNIIPRFQSRTSFRTIRQPKSVSKKHINIKSSLINFKSYKNKILAESKVSKQYKKNDQIIRKNIQLPQNLLDLNQKSSKGISGSILKHKRNKKMSWLQAKSSCNETKLQKFRSTSSPINKEINKIIDLLESENKFNLLKSS